MSELNDKVDYVDIEIEISDENLLFLARESIKLRMTINDLIVSIITKELGKCN